MDFIMKKINVLGNYSGRNAGDAAILGCLLQDLSSVVPGDTLFRVPTINTRFVKTAYSSYSVQPISLMPWTMSVKIFGWPTYHSCMTSDVILVTDAILFDRKLYNPLFNYLGTLSWFLPMAKKRGIPVVLYNCSLGPVTGPAGRRALQRVLDSAEVVILRDRESIELIEREGLQAPRIVEGADCALNAAAVDDNRFQQICEQENLFQSSRPVVGFNVNSYVDAFVREGGKTFGREQLVGLYANTVDEIIRRHDVDILFIETQHMDLDIANAVLAKIEHRDRVRIISNRTYSYSELCSVLKRLQLFVGMRTHSLILSSTMGVVPVGIVTYPKNRGYMRTIGMEENLIEFKQLSLDAFSDKISNAYENREMLRNQMAPHIERERKKARAAANEVLPYVSA